MPKKSAYPGVEQHGKGVRIWFMYKGAKVHEYHSAIQTVAGLKAAARDRAKIVSQIELGSFRYHDWFPDSPRATKVSPSFNDVSEVWLSRIRPELAKKTLLNYVQKLNCYWLPKLAAAPIEDITTGMLKDIAAELTHISPKTYNDSLTPLRGVFDCAIEDNLISANPALRIKSRKRQKTEPDPLSSDEIQAVLNWLLNGNRSDWFPYFALAVDTGMRTSELIALKWSDIDFRNSELRVSRAYVAGEIKDTKTHHARDIELGPMGISALRSQKAKTGLMPEGWVFLDPGTGQIINNDKPPRLVWNHCLKVLGIRHRVAYNTRHTFATLALMDGANIGWISKQLGHSSIKMTTDHYATWISRMDRGAERQKLSSGQVLIGE